MNRLFTVLVYVLLFSCEKDINFDLKQSPEILVVDAQIENGQAPTVVLTKSFSYFAKLDPLMLAGSFVHNANVYMSNGTLTHQLKEDSIPLIAGLYAYVYTIDSSSLSTAFLGELNTTYTLRIESEGVEYTSTVKIPSLAIVPDSIYFKQPPFVEDSNKRIMMVKAQDPLGLGNFVRYFTKTNSNPFFPGQNSVYTDEVIDGTAYDVAFPQGVDKNDPPDLDSNFYNRGDTVTFKFCNIDKPTYTFWSSWEFAYQSIGNPFAQPNKVVGNISNGALGVFSGYAAWYRTLIVN